MMICFDSQIEDESEDGSEGKTGRFNFRSAAVVIHDDHVLIHRAAGDDFWALPGGRVELFESSADAVVREMYEEIGAECEIVRQLWQVESFFEYDSIKFHELGNYFLVSLINQPIIKSEIDFDGLEQAVDLIFRWVPLAKINQYQLYPEFLRKKLTQLPEIIEPLILNEIDA